MKHYLLKTTLRLLLTVVMVYLLPMTAWGQGRQPSGDGNSEGSAYQISERGHLEWMADQVENGNTFEGKFFELLRDIDLSDAPWTTPIGTAPFYNNTSSPKYFAGVFDGDGHKITGLYIPEGATVRTQYLGLFGLIGHNNYSGSTIIIKNLCVEIAPDGIHMSPTPDNLNYPCFRTIGGIAGDAANCTIENCYVTGGGIYCNANLYNGITLHMGGIAGRGQNSIFKNCYATVDIIFDNETVQRTDMTDGISIAGIVGEAGGYGVTTEITNCYYSGKLTVRTSNNRDPNSLPWLIAGIAANAENVTITNCLVLSQKIEEAITPAPVGGNLLLKAIAAKGGSSSTNFVSPQTTINGVAPGYDDAANGTEWTARTDGDAPISTWIGTSNWEANTEWDKCMPTLKKEDGSSFQTTTKQPYVFKEATPIPISNAAELAAINTNGAHLAGSYKLTSDIDLTSHNGGNWTPIGSTATPFKGTFDGDGHLVEGLNAERATPIGLFGVIESGTVENLGVKFGTLKSTAAGNHIGGIAGDIKDNSTIQNCYTAGGSIIAEINSNGTDVAGGIIGKGSQSSILNCYSICNISLKSVSAVNGGGIAGSGTNLIVSNCYTICKIKGIHGDDAGGNAIAGGIIGSIYGIYDQPAEQSRITNCLALSKDEFDLSNSGINTNFFPGRILGEKGFNSNATLSNNYATPLMPGSWTAIGADKNDGGDWNGANCTPSDPDAWNIAWTDMTTTNRAIIGPNLPKLNTTGGTPINGQDDDIDKLLYIGFKLTTTADANGTIEIKNTTGGTLYNDGDYIPANTELTITAKPNSSYKTASLKVSGSNFTSGSSYIVGSDLATKGTDLTVEATFAMTHMVTVNAAIVNGSIEVKKPDGTTLTPGANTVEEGTVLTITATPTTDYQLKQLTADGNPINGNTYTVTGDVTLSAEFEAKSGGGNEGDGGGSTTPTVYHTVTLPAVEGATTDPVAGDYEVEAWGSFRFYLTLDKEYDKSEPVITTDRGETIQPRSSDGAYIVKYVRSDVQILIDSIIKNPDPVGNETVTANQSKVWAAEGYLHIEAATDGQAYIFTADGRLQKLQSVTTGQAIALPLPEGVYLVRIGDERFKVLL
ncbi:MAG: InlB B-repeat-containing protein [Parabacteroides gordonii]|uniref:InlB B-repeat-containing protein n=1 Tax=Parabacteroides gordonii TaxID=574930 RepID=UPI003A838FB8